jgi:hypothetical protein
MLTTVYLNIGNGIQHMKLEDNIEIKGSICHTFRYLGSIFTNSGKCKEEVLNRVEQARKATKILK